MRASPSGSGPEDDDPDEAIVPDGDVVVTCPYCGEANAILLDPGGGAEQEYVEDCPVCCQPWQVQVRWDRRGHADVVVGTSDG
jgi:hypothetical protein